jgi:hypothetical protein
MIAPAPAAKAANIFRISTIDFPPDAHARA